MIHFSFFSGIGGFDLASEQMAWKNYLSCEINPFCNQVLNYYWPNAYHHTDIKTLDYATIDAELSKRHGSHWRNDDIILTGGFPCQPFSVAGKQRGTEDERHLWPQMLRAIREIKPTYVVGENVFGIINWNEGLVFEQVQTDLEVEGYEVQAFVLPACGVNAPHRRDRVWFVGYSQHNGYATAQERRNDNQSPFKTRENEVGKFEGADSVQSGNFTNTNEQGLEGQKRRCKQGFWRGLERRSFCKPCADGNTTSDSDSRRQPSEEHGETQPRRFTKASLSGKWENFPTVSPLCGRNDGFSDKLSGITFSKWRNEGIKAMGNAVVPQVVLQIFKAIEQTRQ